MLQWTREIFDLQEYMKGYRVHVICVQYSPKVSLHMIESCWIPVTYYHFHGIIQWRFVLLKGI